MSKHFDLFDSIEPDVCSFQIRLNGRMRGEAGRSALRLNGAWRAGLEAVMARLYLCVASPRPQILVFVGPEQGNSSHDVCTYTSDLLASRASGAVCLVEANPNVVSLRNQFGVPNSNGLTDLLANSTLDLRSAVAQVPGGDLWLLTSGFPLPAGELLSYSELLDRMNDLRTSFEFVLVDAPPGALSRDAITLAQLADGAVLILPASGGHREPAVRLKDELDDAGVIVLGVVMADHNFPITSVDREA